MKDKIKQLFQGTKEDMIIACNLLVNNLDPWTFIEEWYNENKELSNMGYRNSGNTRPYVVFKKVPPNSMYTDESAYFYYKVQEKVYILCDTRGGISYCYSNYNTRAEVINHF